MPRIVIVTLKTSAAITFDALKLQISFEAYELLTLDPESLKRWRGVVGNMGGEYGWGIDYYKEYV